ncbi:MAG: DUF2922 domain-containing protein [Firmicutes bacterium]|nr:DUF2922 domain-containing protein [Bacillota bacterium]
MADNTKTMRLIFKNQAGANFTLTLDNPRDDVTGAEIEAVMDRIIAANVIATSGGALVSKYDAKIIGQTVNDLYDPAQ